jgi:type II secretory pathway pseudopilin PulG
MRVGRNLKALTLVELLIVLGIIVILVSVSVTIINPNLQRQRSRDAILKNSIASLGQSIDSFYGLRGFYPLPNNIDQVNALRPFISEGFTLGSAANPLEIRNEGIFTGGVAGGPIFYYSNDFNAGGSVDLPCLQAASNEDPTLFVAWAPGFPVTVLFQSCNTVDGYNELTGLSPL